MVSLVSLYGSSRNGEITKEEYDGWRYNYPKYDTYSRRAKVPSQEIWLVASRK